MADPITIMTVGTMAATAAGSIMGAIGSVQKGQAESNMYKYQAGVAKVNQQMAEQNAEWEEAAGRVESQQIGLQGRDAMGKIRVAQAASGLDINTGSAAAVQKSQSQVTRENEQISEANTARRAYGYRIGAIQEEAQSNIDLMGAQQAKTAGTIGAFTSILGGASSVGSQYLKAKPLGMVG